MKVLIVGAGPSGLTAAVELARRGIIPDVIDKKDRLSSLSRAVGIFPATMKILEPSGVAKELENQSIVIQNVKFYKESNLLSKIPINLFSANFFNIYALAQDQTELILSKKFEEYGGTIFYKTELKSLKQDKNKISFKLNNDVRKYDILIGADGTKSSVRSFIGVDFQGYELENFWSIADVYTDTSITNADFQIFIKKDGIAAIMIPLEKHRFRIISNTDDALQEIPLSLPIKEIKRTGKFKISVRQAEQYSRGNVYLVGDAAHSHSPVGGRGMNLGIADAADLANRIINGGLDGYHMARHPVGKEIINITEIGRKIVFSRNTLKKELLFFALIMIGKSKFLNKLFVKKLLTI